MSVYAEDTLSLGLDRESGIAAEKSSIFTPLEVLGPVGVYKDVLFEVDKTQLDQIGDALMLKVRLADMDYDDKGYIQLNGKLLKRLKNDEVTLTERYRKAFGGFGGGYSVFKLDIPVDKALLKLGINTIRFGFDRFDGFSLGYRVLSFNFIHNNQPLIRESRFKNRSLDDIDGRNTVVDARQDSAPDLSEGRQLWNEARLIKSYRNPVTMKARCKDCHFTDGYDLKYFGFSRHSIAKRAVFHGLSEAEGRKIAAYIMSLPAESHGRPWNPPFQPGPGLAQKPTVAWMAGAGIDSVIEDENLTISDLFPAGVPNKINYIQKGRIDLTNVRVALELPVWKHWLPRVHPFEDEVFGKEFESIRPFQFVREYIESNKSNLSYKNPQDYERFRGTMGNLMGSKWYDDVNSPTGLFARLWPLGSPESEGYRGNVNHQIYAYSLQLWRLLKNTEGMHKYGFDQIGHLVANDHLDPEFRTPRALLTKDLFDAAPHMVKLTSDNKYNNSVRNGSPQNWGYFSEAWYYAQLLATDNFREGDGATHWPYTTAFAVLRAGDLDFPGVRLVTQLKVMEAYTFHPLGSGKNGEFTFFPYLNRLNEGMRGRIVQISADNKSKVISALIRGYLDVQNQYSVAQLRAGLPNQFTGQCATSLGVHSDDMEGCAASVIYNMVRALIADSRADMASINALVDSAQTLWPQFAWSCIRDLSKTTDQCRQINRDAGISAR